MGFGTILREQRELKGLSLNDIENNIKIRAKYIEALENEAIDQLPGKVYALGFLKTYSKYLDVDDTELSKELKELYALKEPKEEEPEISTDKSLNINSTTLLIVIAIIIIAIISLFMLSNDKTPNNTDKQPNDQQKYNQKQNQPSGQPEKKDVLQNQQQPQPKESEVIPKKQEGLILKATGRVWVSVAINGKSEFSGILTNGNEKRFEGSNITLKIGNAGALDVTYNGEHLGYLGQNNKVITKTFNSSH